ncbi:MAG: PfkB family carbohydrate kinase [Oscillospiraceae bacterium]|nr:PfkB family carbohydrate kinase [Oscillospiraceae bacterium]
MTKGLNKNMKKILCLSCTCVDVFPEKGTAEAGGNALNVAANCVKTGKAEVYLMGNIGNDSHAEEIKKKTDSYKINRDKLYEVEGESASNKVYLTADGDRYFPDGSWTSGVYAGFKISKEDELFMKQMDAVASTFNDSVFPQLLEISPSSGFLLSMDFMEHKPKEEWREFFPAVNLFFISGKPEDLPLLKQWSLEFPTLFVATLGENGSIAYKNGEEYKCEAVNVAEVVDTTGCGDSYQGAFIVDYLHSSDVESAMRAGSQAAATTLSFVGAC